MGAMRLRIAALAVVLVALSACGPAAPRTIEGELDRLQVTVIDQSGHLRSVGFRGVSQLPIDELPTNAPGQADVVWIGWLTRVCGHSTIVIALDGDRLRATVETPDNLERQNDVGVWRTIAPRFEEPVDASRVDVEELRDP
jgi:hypothetical protein